MADTCAAESVNTCLPPVGSPFMKSALLSHVVLPALCLTPLATLVLFPLLWRALGSFLGWYLRKKTDGRRCHILEVVEADEKKYQEERASEVSRGEAGEDVGWEKVDAHALGTAQNGGKGGDDENWAGVVGFFHPFCDAGGGGERVLWAAIRATQQRWPKAKCVVYTGDHDVSKDAMLARVKNRFNIHLHPPTINFLYLTTRHWVLASTWPHFTLAGQSFGSLILAWDAFSLLVPDIFVDTMGYAFALGLSKFLFRDVPTGAYVHYPTISTDMLDSLDPASAVGSQGVNASQGVGVRGGVKKLYWRLFARAYSRAGASADVVMTNSSWTQAHIQKLWGPLRQRSPNNSRLHPIAVVYPPVAVRELEHEVEVSPASEARREKVLLYIAQFRPEKNHALILQAFAHFLKQQNNNTTTATGSDNSNSSNNNNNNNNGGGPRLVLVGSVRDDSDSKRVYQLRLLANELGVRGRVEFHLDASWPEILDWLRRASVGVNGMWNEHFGIGVVEYQAAGLVAVVHDSGGPRMDIVVDVEGGATGFHATTAAEFAQAFDKALNLPDPYAVRRRARQSAKRFTEEEFARRWIEQMEKLVAARVGKKTV